MKQDDAADPLWYKDAILYEVHVRAFADSDGDGMGDFRGLTAKLDYLRDLGITAIWLLPFYPSPWRDDGYDIADYTSVHPAYGTLDDFRAFLDAAHRRDLKVVTELVINHTSDRHPWFERARRAAPGTPERDFYVWSDSPDRYADARIIFTDTETSNWTWDPVAKAYYWHRFFSHQPDLNFDNPQVHAALLAALDFWMELGVDGLRLDAVPYLYEREGTNCENLPETHAFLRRLRAHVDARFSRRMLLAEANQWPEDSIAYFGDPERGAGECHMAFHFPVMPRLYMAIRMEDRYPVVDILEQTPPIPESCQWATFLRNHDELTLEMVTDEDRDYMYRVYARDTQARINVGIRRRLAPLMGKDRRRIELMNSLLFSLPGAPVLYYGDEIGMGDNIYIGDRNGVRTPMQWNGDRNAGFSAANPQRLYLPVIIDPEYHYQAINVDTQQSNPHSLLWWTRRLIHLRRRHRAFSRGSLEFLKPQNHHVLAFLRRHQDETLLVVANLSRFVQQVELDLGEMAGWTPVELFGGTALAAIEAGRPYTLTVGPHNFFWFALERERAGRRQGPRGAAMPSAAAAATVEDLPVIALAGAAAGAAAAGAAAAAEADWRSLFAGPRLLLLEAALARRLPDFRWFAGKARALRTVAVSEAIPLDFLAAGDSAAAPASAYLLLLEVTYEQGEPERYALPVAFAPDAPAAPGAAEASAAAPGAGEAPSGEVEHAAPLARVESGGAAAGGVLYDPFEEPDFARGLLAAIAAGRRCGGPASQVAAWTAPSFAALAGEGGAGELEPRPLGAEQSNSSVRYGNRLVLKLFRKLEPGVNPDLEISRFLSEQTTFRHMPPLAGGLDLLGLPAGGLGLPAGGLALPAAGSAALPGQPPPPQQPADAGRGREPVTLGLLQGFVPNEGDAWSYTLDALGRYFERVRTGWGRGDFGPAALPAAALLDLVKDGARGELPAELHERIGTYLTTVGLLGERTAELHIALAAAPPENAAFAPEPFSTLHQRSLYESMRTHASRTFDLLRQREDSLPAPARAEAAAVLAAQGELRGRFGRLLGPKVTATRSRTHGDYHLGQVLYTGKDFVILDFEGEPARSLSERRLKRSPLRDVAGMLRSFQYAAHARLFEELASGIIPAAEQALFESWALFWERWVSAAFLAAYLARAGSASFVPADRAELAALLDAYLLEKAIYELAYELNHRPGWVRIPLAGIRQILGLPAPPNAAAPPAAPVPPAPPPSGSGR
jgi:maltose alpha-D-glucosyltransferase/alpha-amylase